MNHALIIGRFQLVGNQHVDLFRQVVEFHKNKKLDCLNVGIGVSCSLDFDNSFSGTECLEMILPVAKEAADQMDIALKTRLVPDINDPLNYEKHVSEIFGLEKDDSVFLFSNNEYTNGCFRKKDNYVVIETQERISQHSTELRKLYVRGADISLLVPDHIGGFLKEHNAKKRLERILYDNPVPTVDVVIEYDGGIVVVERKEMPFGYALPGGHIDYGESAEAAAVREAKEETGLDVKLLGLVGVFSRPDRDPRGHKITIVYSALGTGKLKAGSDAKRVNIMKGYHELLFDHNEILEKYLHDGKGLNNF